MSSSESLENMAERVDTMACSGCGRHLDVSQHHPFSEIECPACHTRQTVPAVLGNFLLVEVLGSGGMGAVFRALDQALGRFVAIKVMKKALGVDSQLVESFLREARAAAALNHRNIVQIYSCGQEKGQPYIVMELVNGGRLDQMLEGGKSISEVRALEVGLDVDEGLRAANEVGLVHGDIKPANILFDGSGTAKVVDFGLAQFVNKQSESGGIWGTPYYISPERARGGKADHRSDIYSLGATLFHALTGKPPFDGATAGEVVVARLKAPAPDVREFNDKLQPQTASVISRMLAADPVTRYPNSASLLADMTAALSAAHAVESGGSAAKGKPEERRVGKSVAVVAVLVVLAVVVLVAKQIFMKPEEKPAPSAVAVVTPALAPTPDTNKAAEPAPVPAESTQFFDDAGSQRIVEAAKALTSETPMAMYEQLAAFANELPKNSARAMWLRVLQAAPCMLERREDESLELLQQVAKLPIAQNDTHPINMPKFMAQYALGEITEGDINSKRQNWPSWYGDLSKFYAGMERLSFGDFGRSTTLLTAYQKSAGDSQFWPYAFGPLAGQLVDQLATWKSLRKRAGKMQPAEALAAMEKFRDQVRPILKKHVEVEVAKLRETVGSSTETVSTPPEPANAPAETPSPPPNTRRSRTDSGSSSDAEARAYRERVQQDLDRIDNILAENAPIVLNQKDYKKASQSLSRVQTDLQTDEGRAALEIVREQYDRMDGLKNFLASSFEADPFRQSEGTDLGGDAVGASPLGVRVALGTRGVIVKPWDQIGIRTILKTATYYLADARRSDKDRADMMLSLAVFCYINGGFDAAANFAGQATRLDPTIVTAARRLMPDVLSD